MRLIKTISNFIFCLKQIKLKLINLINELTYYYVFKFIEEKILLYLIVF